MIERAPVGDVRQQAYVDVLRRGRDDGLKCQAFRFSVGHLPLLTPSANLRREPLVLGLIGREAVLGLCDLEESNPSAIAVSNHLSEACVAIDHDEAASAIATIEELCLELTFALLGQLETILLP